MKRKNLKTKSTKRLPPSSGRRPFQLRPPPQLERTVPGTLKRQARMQPGQIILGPRGSNEITRVKQLEISQPAQAGLPAGQLVGVAWPARVAGVTKLIIPSVGQISSNLDGADLKLIPGNTTAIVQLCEATRKQRQRV